MGPKGGDKRWYPAVYHEQQCGKKVSGDNDLCTTCQRRKDRFAADYEPSKIPTKVLNTRWCGLVTEEVSDYQHTAGTKWANGLLDGQENPVWIGEIAATLDGNACRKLAAVTRSNLTTTAPTLVVEERDAPAPAAPDLAAAFSTLVAALKGSGKTIKITIELSS